MNTKFSKPIQYNDQNNSLMDVNNLSFMQLEEEDNNDFDNL
jgi:hypothetical protein